MIPAHKDYDGNLTMVLTEIEDIDKICLIRFCVCCSLEEYEYSHEGS